MIGCIFAVSLGAVTNTWTMWGGEPSHQSVQLTKGAMSSAPVIKWARSAGSFVEWQFSGIADVDGGGDIEVVICSGDKNVYCLRGTNGNPKWTRTLNGEVWTSPAIADLDGDGSVEIVVGTWDPMGDNNATVYCLRGSNGNVRWSREVASSGSAEYVISSPAVANLDGDPQLEVVIASSNDTVYCFSSGGARKWRYKTGNDIHSSPAIGDVDGDGQLEVIIGSDDRKVYCLNGSNGAKEWDFTTGGMVRSSPTIADLDGDGSVEIVIGSYDGKVYCIRGSNGTEKWAFQTGNVVQSSASVADVNRDNKLEVIIGSNDHKVYCLSSEGTKLWEYPARKEVHLPGALVDIDGDGWFEYLVATIDTFLACINAESGTELWKIKVAWDVHSPFAGDIDGDGCSEIIVGTMEADAQGRLIFAFDDVNNTQGCGPVYEDVEEGLGKGFEFRAAGQGIYLFIPQQAQVSLTLYDAQGRLVQRLYDGVLTQGGHTFNPKLEAGGVYMVVLRYQGGMKSLKIVR